MRFFGRRNAGGELPASVRESLSLSRGEKVLASAPVGVPGGVTGGEPAAAGGQGWAVATTYGLVLLAAGGLAQRRGWEDVDAGTWDDERSQLVLRWVDRSPVTLLPVDREAGSFLPEAVRERVQASVVLTHRVAVQNRRGVRIAVRRVLRDGSLTTQVLPDAGVRLDDPAVAALVEPAHREVRAQAGLPV